MVRNRTIITLVIAIGVLSVFASVMKLLSPPDSDGWGRDSYGTRSYGHRALLEILPKVGIQSERLLVPPDTRTADDVVIAEPAYLENIRGWVEQGGTVVVVPYTDGISARYRFSSPIDHDKKASPYILPSLGITNVSVIPQEEADEILSEIAEAHEMGTNAPDTNDYYYDADYSACDDPDECDCSDDKKKRKRRRPTYPTWIERLEQRSMTNARTASVACNGEWKHLSNIVGTLRITEGTTPVLYNRIGAEPIASIVLSETNAAATTIAAMYAVGQGRVIVVSDPFIMANGYIAKEDNAVLVVNLLGGEGKKVLFDEFYHGLTVRGNPMWLMSRVNYAVFIVALLIASLLWVWRASIRLGPPITQHIRSRRDVAEYIEAMSNLFHRPNCRAFVLKSIEDGAFWYWRRKLFLSAGTREWKDIFHVARKRYPEQCVDLEKSVTHIINLTTSKRQPSNYELLHAAREITKCL